MKIKNMKKNYMKPMAKCINMRLENILAGSIIESGEGDGPHDANSKKFSFDDDDAF